MFAEQPGLESRRDEKSSSDKRVVKVDIVSDTVCPWCFIGKRRFEKAVAQLDSSKVEVQVNWRPWFLDHTLPVPGKSSRSFIVRKFGDERSKQLFEVLDELGKTVDIHFDCDGVIGNTLNSHRLVQWSKKFGRQNAVMDNLFRAWAEQKKDLSDINVLLDCAEKSELKRDETKKFLESDELTDFIKQQVVEMFERDVTGVPHFIFDGKFALSGSQETAAFLNMFRRLGVLELTDAEHNQPPAPVPAARGCGLGSEVRVS